MTNQTKLPKGLVVGPMKCGTSWIHDYLAARGDVCLPDFVKETFYFDRHHDRGLDWYAERFSPTNAHAVTVEVGSSLFHTPDAPQWVLDDLGDIPIVVTLREPIARSWSHYQHMRCGETNAPLQEAVVQFPEILDASRITRNLPRWQEKFTKVTVLTQDQLIAEPDAYAAALAEALNLPTTVGAVALEDLAKNEATSPRSFALAWVGRRVSRGLRRVGLYRLVDAARKTVLKSLLFGKTSKNKAQMSDADRAFLEAELAGETKAYAALKD